MGGNKAVAYVRPGEVQLQDTPFPDLVLRDGPGVNPLNVGRKCNHGVTVKVVATNIGSSYQHMVRGRTTAPSGLILGHEITGEVIETGRDVEFIKKGDLVSVPFNIARSEERRVGKECRLRGWRGHEKENEKKW